MNSSEMLFCLLLQVSGNTAAAICRELNATLLTIQMDDEAAVFQVRIYLYMLET